MPILVFLTVSVYYFFSVWTLILCIAALRRILAGPNAYSKPFGKVLFHLIVFPAQSISNFAKKELHVPCFLMRIVYFVLALIVGVMGEPYRSYNSSYFFMSRISVFYFLFSTVSIKRCIPLRIDVASLPSDFRNRSLSLALSIAKLSHMNLSEYLHTQQSSLSHNRGKWRTTIELPLSRSLSECENLIIYQAAASGRSVEEQLHLLQDDVSHNRIPDPPDYYSPVRTALDATAFLWLLLIASSFFLIAYKSNKVGIPFFSNPGSPYMNYSESNLSSYESGSSQRQLPTNIHSLFPTPTPTPKPTPRPTPSPTPYQPRDDDIGITYEEFMQGFEEYKRNGGSGYSSDTWGEDNTTNEVTGDLGMIVYWTPGGKSYHFSITCPSLSRSKEIYYSTLQEAINAGKTDPCNNCAY